MGKMLRQMGVQSDFLLKAPYWLENRPIKFTGWKRTADIVKFEHDINAISKKQREKSKK